MRTFQFMRRKVEYLLGDHIRRFSTASEDVKEIIRKVSPAVVGVWNIEGSRFMFDRKIFTIAHNIKKTDVFGVVQSCAQLRRLQRFISNTVKEDLKDTHAAVVGVSVFEDIPGAITSLATGTGVIIDFDGLILTSANLVANNCLGGVWTPKGKIEVVVQDGRKFVGEFIFADFNYGHAFIKVDADDTLPVAKIGFSSQICKGDQVTTMEWPIFSLSSIAKGTVSSVGGQIKLHYEDLSKEYLKTGYAQGNFGGPVLNIHGEIIGINLWVVPNSTEHSLAIPIDRAMEQIKQLRKYHIWHWYGLHMHELKVKEEKDDKSMIKGIFVDRVTSGSLADHAGFHATDIITEINGNAVGSFEEFMEVTKTGSSMWRVNIERYMGIKTVLEIFVE